MNSRLKPKPEIVRWRSRSRLRPKICYETETKIYDSETKISGVKSIEDESERNRYV